MPRLNRFGRVGLCIALVVSVAGCYTRYPYNPYAPNGPGAPPTYQQPGPVFPNGTMVQPGTSYVVPSGPAAYGTTSPGTTNLPPSTNGYEPVPATNGGSTSGGSTGGTSPFDDMVPPPRDINNGSSPNGGSTPNNGSSPTTDPFGESAGVPNNNGSSPPDLLGKKDVRDPFEPAIDGMAGHRSIAPTIS